MNCVKCSAGLRDGANFCDACGAPQMGQTASDSPNMSTGSIVTYRLLAFFLGILGIHDFYAGYLRRGVIHALFFWIGVTAWWTVLFVIPETSSSGWAAMPPCGFIVSPGAAPVSAGYVDLVVVQMMLCCPLVSLFWALVELLFVKNDARQRSMLLVSSDGRTLEKYHGGARTLAIPEGTTAIGKGAFGGCSHLVSVKIPSSVTSIGAEAFEGCSRLESVTIPTSVTGIGKLAFSGCSRLAEVTIPSGVTEIGEFAFYRCTSLVRAEIPAGVTAVKGYAFYECTSLASVTIPSGVTEIGGLAFYGCSSLASVTIPTGVTTIGELAFEGCSALAEVKIPSSVTSIGRRAFDGCGCEEQIRRDCPDLYCR